MIFRAGETYLVEIMGKDPNAQAYVHLIWFKFQNKPGWKCHKWYFIKIIAFQKDFLSKKNMDQKPFWFRRRPKTKFGHTTLWTQKLGPNFF